jgi:hypothetical protein
MRGKLATVIDQIEHGHHVFRAYFKHAFLKQYEKFAGGVRQTYRRQPVEVGRVVLAWELAADGPP